MTTSFRSSRLQLTTAAGYRMTRTAKVLIAVTLFLLESLLLRTRLTRFLYSAEVALQHTSLSLLHDSDSSSGSGGGSSGSGTGGGGSGSGIGSGSGSGIGSGSGSGSSSSKIPDK